MKEDEMDNVTQSISTMTSRSDGSVATFNGNFAALVESGHIWTAGCHEIVRTMTASAQAQLERNLSTWKAMTGIKSVQEAMALNAQITRSAVEHAVAETGKLAEASLRLAEQTMVPVKARMTLAAEKLSPPAIRE